MKTTSVIAFAFCLLYCSPAIHYSVNNEKHKHEILERKIKYLRNKIPLNKINGVCDTIINQIAICGSKNSLQPICIDSSIFGDLGANDKARIDSCCNKNSHIKLVDSTAMSNIEHYGIIWIEAHDSVDYFWEKGNKQGPSLQIEDGGCRKSNCTSAGGTQYILIKKGNNYYFTGKIEEYYY